MNGRSWLLPLLAIVTIMAGIVSAEEIPRDEYLKYLPLSHSKLGRQTDASKALNLFGDPGDPAYRDMDPVDGIDDGRGEILQSLAVRFAPFLVQNTSNIPVNFDVFIQNAESFPLIIDTWEISGDEPALVASDSIDFAVLQTGSDGYESEDSSLIGLINRHGPGSSRPTTTDPRVKQRPDSFAVLYFNFPGVGPGTWEQSYRGEYEKTPPSRQNSFPQSYVHPFLHEAVDSTGVRLGYELVLQYWFFYPSNDGGNNHEGDWEHINVVVSPLSMVESPVSGETVQTLLSGSFDLTDSAADPVVIKRVEYYFHHFVMTLDFSSPNVYASREEWKNEVKNRPTSRYQEREIWKSIRRMAYADDDETIINTHPFGYIGADNKGIDQALAMPGGKNQDSHGTYPFPGRYNSIGPAGATEQITVNVDPRRFLKQLRAGEETMGPIFEHGGVLGLADPERLRLVPDWERTVELVRTHPEARRDWSWLVLPIYWGYPATKSPFAGIVEHTETGNLPPHGPAFNPGWNVSGPAPGFATYEPHIMPSIFPVGFYDGFRNDLGFFNFTVPLLFNLPPLDFVSRVATYPFKVVFGTRDPLYYPKEGLPNRFVSVSSGLSVQSLDEDFAALTFNKDQFEPFVASLLLHLLFNGSDSTTTITGGRDVKENSVQPFYQISFYIGSHFTSENTVRNVRSTFGADVEFSNIPPYSYRADLNLWEYAGSIRYSILPSHFQPFVKAGYGWSWYRLQNVRVNGVELTPAESQWFKPGILPGVWHLGLGLEVVPWKRVGRYFGGIEVAFRVEYARYFQSLDLDLSEIPLEELRLLFPTLGDVPGSETVTRDDFVFGVTVSF